MMKALTELSLLKVPSLVSDRPVPEAEDRVVELFRNRAELKKAYGELESEVHRLKDRLKQQEGATQRVEELLETLEQRLAATETAYPTMVFYHLRGLWQLGRELITQLVADLSRQNEDRERKLHLAEFNRRQFALRQGLETDLNEAKARCAWERDHLRQLEERRTQLTRFWHYFQRREVDAALAASRRTLEASRAALRTAEQAMVGLEGTAAGEFPGLSVDAQRAINLAGIAYAELLCARLAGTPLVHLAREAMGRRQATDEYGTREECEARIAEIARARSGLPQRANLNEELRGRIERLRRAARYAAAEDTMPTTESFAADAAATGAFEKVLTDDAWDLCRILLR